LKPLGGIEKVHPAFQEKTCFNYLKDFVLG